MTITEALTYVKSIMNESSSLTPNWSDSELYKLFEAKSNVVLSIIGLIEGKDLSLTSVIGQADYAFPSNFITIRRVWYKGIPLKYLGFREFESRMPTGITQSGTPREMRFWSNTISMIPTPNVAGDQITIFGEKMHSPITGPGDTLQINAVFHPALCDMVIADMYAKDLNSAIYDRFNDRCEKFHIPAMREFAKRRQRRGLPARVIDADSVLETELGIA